MRAENSRAGAFRASSVRSVLVQTTLLGLALAMILALLAALVGPHFVDWDGWRETFETEASRAVGAPVSIGGPIAVRVLPTPSLDLGGVSVAAGGTRVSARALRVELALAPLMRGEWRVAELALDAPQLALALDPGGRLAAPSLPAGFDPERLSIDRLVIEHGRAVLADPASGGSLTLDNLTFKGDLRSLAGPLRGEGAFVTGGTLYGVRLATGRPGPDGAVRLRFGLDPLDRPLTVEADGVLRLDTPGPRWEGGVTLARPAAASRGVRAGAAPSGPHELDLRELDLREPWRLTGRLDATPARLSLTQGELQYGPEERALRLAGTADLVLGRFPRLDLAVSGRQLDLDRVIPGTATLHAAAAGPAGGARPLVVVPEAMRRLLATLRPPLPTTARLDIEALTAAGSTLQGLRGTVATTPDGGLRLTDIEARLPGLTQVRLGGTLAAGADLAFTGPVTIESSDPWGLAAWIEGGRADPARPAVGPLRASGEVTADRDRVAIERLAATVDRKSIEGRVAYTRPADGRPARIDAALTAAEIDLEGTTALLRGVLGGSLADWPREAGLSLSAGKAAWGAIEASRVDARLGFDAGGLTVERLTVGDLRGATLEASGRIDTTALAPAGSALQGVAPRGAVTLLVKAPRADMLVALATEIAPRSADELRRTVTGLGPTELRAKLEVEPTIDPVADPAAPSATRAQARLALDGRVGAMRLAATVTATGDPAAPAAARLRFDGTVEAKEGAALAALTGLDRLAAIDRRPATLTLTGGGRLDGDINAKLEIAAGGLQVSATGTGRRDGDRTAGRADLSLTAADLRALALPGAPPLPATLRTRLSLDDTTVRLDDVAGRVAGATVTGHLGLTRAAPRTVSGRIEASEVDAAPLVALLSGAAARRPPPAAGREGSAREGSAWSSEPFGRPAFADLHGRVEIAAARATLWPGLVARDVETVLRLDGTSLAVEGLGGTLAGGALSADATLRTVPTGLAAQARLALVDADLALLLPGTGKAPPAEGRVSLSSEIEGAGLSPAALVGALAGSGAVRVERAQVVGIDPKAIDAGIRAVERGLPLERLAGYVGSALEAGRLAVPSAAGALAIVDGRVRLGPMEATVDGAAVALTAGLDLGADALDARVTLTAPPRDDGPGGRRPELGVALRGPPSAPKRTVDTTALVTWVTLRSVEQEAKRVEAAEKEAKRREAAAAAAAAERAAERLRLEQERQAREQVAREQREQATREQAARERAAREAAARPTIDPAVTGTAEPSAPAPAPVLPPAIEVRPGPVVRSPPATRPAGAAAPSGAAPAAPGQPREAQQQPSSVPSPVRSLLQMFNLQ